ncbi:MAG: dUTP diphosphatase [Candidatus Pacebacteria bacterium]|nr:dUTP diphosphatase [Candidatus Paceibacterota bacterium]
MNIKIKRFDKELPLPGYQTEGAAAFDLAAREAVTIAPGAIGYVPLNIAVETPAGYFLLLAARSGTHKKGLMMANGIGVIDPDFSGDDDEMKAAYYNFTAAPVVVEKGERIAQGTFVPVTRAEWEESDSMGNRSRGGFGTTGK